MIKAGPGYDQRNEFEHRDNVQRDLEQKYDKRSNLTVPIGKKLSFTSAQGQVIEFGYNADGQFTIKQDASTPVGMASISYVSTVESTLETSIATLTVDVTAANAAAVAAASSAASAATSATAAGTSATASQTSATTASTQASNAATSASQSSTSATNAAGSAATATTQATNAANSATNAGNSATAASNSASTASTQATNAGNSATASQNSATSAATEASNAATSAGAASTSASNASTSASQASTSASNAAGSASSASTQATNAAGSATAAGNSATAASTSASNASTSATNAGNSASSASTSATNAASSQSAAAGSASAASTSASTASTQASNAATSASAASTSATTATTQASNASTSASQASTSAGNAAASATTASTQASNAAGSASSASSSASAASASATAASSSATLSATYALGAQGSINSSATFADNANATGEPTNWSNWSYGYTGTRVTGIAPQPYAFSLVGGAGLDVGIVQDMQQRLSQGWHVLEADITLVSGALTGAAVYMHWGPIGSFAASASINLSADLDITGAAPGTGTTGRLYKYRKLVNVNSDCYEAQIYAMTHWSAAGSIAAANSITWHRCAVRAASQAEIEARQAKNDLVTTNANVATNTSAIATETSARAAADTTLTARANTLYKASQNLLKNSTFINNGSDWVTSGSPGYFGDGDNRYIAFQATSYQNGYQDVLVVAGRRYSLSAEMYRDTSSMSCRVYVQWLDTTRTTDLGYGAVINHPSTGWVAVKADLEGVNAGMIAPTNAVWARIFVDNYQPSSYPSGTSAVRRVCFNGGDYAVPWSEGPVEAALAATNATVATNTSAIATETSARAAADTVLSAQVAGAAGGPAINSSPNFADNANATGVPTNWSDWTFAAADGVRVTGIAPQPYAYQQAGRAGANSGLRQVLEGRLAPGWYVLEADAELISGTFVSAGVFVYSSSSGGDQSLNVSFSNDADVSGTAPGNGSTGRIYRWRKLVQFTQTAPNPGWPAIYAASHWDGLGSFASANVIKFHRAAIRAASQAEIEARQAKNDLVTANAAITANQSAQAGVNSAQATTNSALTATITSIRSGGDAVSLPSTFEKDDLYWTQSGGSFVTVSNIGRVFQSTSTFPNVRSRGRIQLRPNRTYRCTARYRVVTDATNGVLATPLAGLTTYNSAGSNIAGVWVTPFATRTVADGWITSTSDFSTATIIGAEGTGAAVEMDSYCQPGWHGSSDTNAVTQVQFVKLEDVTDAVVLTASVTTNASAIATVDGKLSASYGLTVDANGRIASMKLLSNGTTSSVKFTADTFQVFNGSTDVAPFEVTGGNVKIKSANVGTLNVGSGGLTIQSGSSGARIVISNSVVEVYDATRLRVRMGLW